jgi:hypothetical protein
MKRSVSIFSIVMAALLLSVGLVSAAVQNHRAHLSGRYTLPAVVDTAAQGQAVFQMNKDGTAMSYKLNVADIDNVTMAHIHLKPAGGTGNGPIIVWLYPSAPPAVLIPGTTNGVLASGMITDANVMRDYDGNGVKNLTDLVAAIEANDTYVNVHTSANPAGEIHGPVH